MRLSSVSQLNDEVGYNDRIKTQIDRVLQYSVERFTCALCIGSADPVIDFSGIRLKIGFLLHQPFQPVGMFLGRRLNALEHPSITTGISNILWSDLNSRS